MICSQCISVIYFKMLCEQRKGSIGFCLGNGYRRHHKDSELYLVSVYNPDVSRHYSPDYMWGALGDEVGRGGNNQIITALPCPVQIYQVYPLVYGKVLRGFDKEAVRTVFYFTKNIFSEVLQGITRIGCRTRETSFTTLTILEIRRDEGLNQGSDKRMESRE